MKQAYEISVLNHKLVLKTDDGEPHVKKVADYVNKKMHEVQQGAKATSTLNVAILAALNIADDFFKLKKKNKTVTEKWINKLAEIKSVLDRL